MSRFAYVYEDPSYEIPDDDEGDWEDVAPVAKKPQEEEYSPHATMNS